MQYLLAKNTINGAKGTVVITLDGKNYVIAGMQNIRIDADIQSSDMKCIGTTKVQDKQTGVKLTGKGNIYYGSDLFTNMVLDYIKTGKTTEFTVQVTNDDPSADIGTQAMAYYGCHLTGQIPLSILDDNEAMLNYDFNFACTDVEKLQSFRAPSSYGND